MKTNQIETKPQFTKKNSQLKWKHTTKYVLTMLNTKIYENKLKQDVPELTQKKLKEMKKNMAMRNPITVYNEFVEIYGTPSLLDPLPGGMAVWLPKDLKERGWPWLVRIILVDKVAYHSNPAPHLDCIETVYHIGLPVEEMMAYRSSSVMLSASVFTDPLMGNSHARCHFDHANNVSNYLVTGINYGNVTLKTAKKLYGPYIMAGMKMHKSYDPKFPNLVRDTLKKIYETKKFIPIKPNIMN